MNKKLLTISIVIYKIKLTELKRFLNYCDKIKFSHKVFIIDNNILQTQKKYLDECTLCDLCIDAAGAENIKIIKLY